MIAGVDITLLCKVVDNYGDIGVVYRLARSLSEQPEPPALRLVVDDLAAFRALAPEVDAAADYQRLCGWELYRWGADETCAAAFRARPPEAVVECFACGRPDWLEALLFDDPVISERGCLLVDLEYLTAEQYAEDFHLMPSLTRSAAVRKAMFLPGFTAKTGGLVLDSGFMAARSRAASASGRLALRRELLRRVAATGPAAASAAAALPADAADRFWVTVFSYERDYSRIVADLAAFAEGRAGTAGGQAGRRPVLALTAAGKSQACFRAAWEAADRPFPLLELPFLPQETWDELLLASGFSIVRGEDSWARAALAGRPFLWQAYLQAERYQMVKVEAFLKRIEPFFPSELFASLAAAYRAFNDRDCDDSATAGPERILSLLEHSAELGLDFGRLADELGSMPGLAANLVTFLREML